MDEDGRFTNALESGASNIELPASLHVSASGYLYCFTKGTTENPGSKLAYRIKAFVKAAST